MNDIEYRLVGSSKRMSKLRRQVSKLARLTDTVLIQGERGTGKELVARSLHKDSKRRGGPFVLVDCSALTETVFESDLFGHERGSFTGAHKQKIGLLEDAQHGTLFFDEISHLRPVLQGKLLRFLESRTIRRVGGRVQLNIDARVVVATNRDLSEMVERGEFLPDLFDRLNILRIETPPLREHLEDIPELAEYFCAVHGFAELSESLTEEILNTLREYDWPGNVRQLLNVLRRVDSIADEAPIPVESFTEAMRC